MNVQDMESKTIRQYIDVAALMIATADDGAEPLKAFALQLEAQEAANMLMSALMLGGTLTRLYDDQQGDAPATLRECLQALLTDYRAELDRRGEG